MSLPTKFPWLLQQDSPRERKQGERQDPYDKTHQFLSLKLSLSIKDLEELNPIDTFNAGKEAAEPRVFSCNYCQRKFFNSQALGGHQNAHSRERELAKTGFKNSCLSSLPLHGLCRSLGIQTHSMVHKPSSRAPKFHRQPRQLFSKSFRSPNGGREASAVVASWRDRYSKHKHNELLKLDCLDLSLRL